MPQVIVYNSLHLYTITIPTISRKTWTLTFGQKLERGTYYNNSTDTFHEHCKSISKFQYAVNRKNLT